MRHKALKTIGATAVLLGVAVAGVVQINSQDEPSRVELAAGDPTTPLSQQVESLARPEAFVYRVGVLAGITTDNFWAFYGEQPSVWNSYILGPTKLALYGIDPTEETLTPELAMSDVSPTMGPDGWRVDITLSDRYRWSDGTPITAHDLVFTFESVRELGLDGSWGTAFSSIVESISAASDHALIIRFNERPNLSVWPHGVGLAPIMARHIWEDRIEGISANDLYSLSGESDVSGGPLTLSMAADYLVVSNANPGYPDSATPDTVEYYVFPDEAALVDALASGHIDAVLTPRGLAPEQLLTVAGNPSVGILASPANDIRYLAFNMDRDPMSDQAFRTALALLLDRQGLADTVGQTGQPAFAFVPEANSRWFNPRVIEASQRQYEGEATTRLALAIEGLRNAGYEWKSEPALVEDGELIAGAGVTIDGLAPLPLTILTPGDEYDPTRPQYVQEIADTLGFLGFDVRPVETDFDTVVDLVFTPDDDGALHYDMYLLGWTLGNPALPDYYRPLFAPNGAMNNTGYASARFNQALEEYEAAYTSESAFEALWNMEQTLATDLPYLLLYTSQITEIYRSDRVSFDVETSLGGLQARLGGIEDVRPTD